MTHTPTAPDRGDLEPLHRRIPPQIWWAAAVALLAFPLGITLQSETVENGVQTSCSFTDVGALAAAALVVVLVGSAFFANGTRRVVQPRRHLAPAVLAAVAVPLLAAAAYHVVSGLGLVGGPCG